MATNFCITAASVQGGRRYMEDRVHIECARKEDGSLDYIFAAVYDGHGGAQASEYTRENLLENIRTQKGFNSECDEEVLKAIKTGFLKTHDSMLKISETWPRTASGYSCTAGTTASCVFIRNCKIYVGHVGDSSVIMGYSDSETKEDCLKAKQLTVDHKPDNATELSRIQFAGGCVLPKSGISRVVWTRPIRGHRGPIRRSTPTEQIPFLAIARSLGDFWSYNDITEEFVVSPVPDVSVYNLTPADKCIFVVSDGVTNVMSSASIMKALHTSINNIEENEPSTSINPAHSVIKSVLESWSILRADNISIVCIMLEHANETSISANSIQEDLNTSIDLELTKNPTAMIKISKDTITSFSTEPVKLKYRGAIDKEATTLKYSGPGFVIVEREDEPVDEEERHFAKNRRNSIDDSQEVPHVSDAELEVTYEEGDEEEEEFDSPPLAAPFSSYDYPSSSN
uniref:PPM-type phosphatase domain-containing protein n=1 Tax=Acrobeloides nanus TaxID=290746 RepID=A0A914EDW2_9BILA